MGNTITAPNSALDGIIDVLVGLREGIRITQVEIRTALLFRSLLDKVTQQDLRRNLSAVERVWEMTIMARIDAGADIEAGRYIAVSNHNWSNRDVGDHPLLICEREGHEPQGSPDGK